MNMRAKNNCPGRHCPNSSRCVLKIAAPPAYMRDDARNEFYQSHHKGVDDKLREKLISRN
jgi:hypothetical protein